MSWNKLEPVQGRQQPCLHAGVAAELFSPAAVIAIGFGAANLTCDGGLVYEEPDSSDERDYMTGAQAEEIAAKDPDHDWQISLYGPMSSRVYQRHGENQWVLVYQDDGFA